MPEEKLPFPQGEQPDQPHMQDPMAEKRDEMALGELQAKHEKLQDEYKSLQNDRERLQQALADKTRELAELQQAHGIKVKPPYEYGDDECRPVSPGGKCEQCGWDYNTQRRPDDEKREPHPVAL